MLQPFFIYLKPLTMIELSHHRASKIQDLLIPVLVTASRLERVNQVQPNLKVEKKAAENELTRLKQVITQVKQAYIARNIKTYISS